MKKRTQSQFVLISIRVEVTKLVKVKPFIRIRNGKIEKVKAHFRKY